MTSKSRATNNKDVAKAAISRIQKSEVSCQNFKASHSAIYLNSINNVGDLCALKKLEASHLPTFKPKAVNGKQLAAANQQAKNFL